ncbi:MAG: transposase [Candidatus Yonathbacteria bacterium]|nr:transposase [Candidatus Yonathbacteria bacterium]
MKQKQCKKVQEVNQVKIEFTNKSITAWGGMACQIGKYLEVIDFRGWVENHFPITETSPFAKGIYEKALGQFLTVLVGGSRFGHLSWWGHGIEAVSKMFDVAWLPCSASTLTRFWGKIKTQGMAEKMGDAGRQLAKTLWEWESIGEDNLNFDSSVLTRYGDQPGAKKGYNPKKHGRNSHHPILAFLGSGYIVNLWNRSGNVSSAHRITEFFDATVASLGSGFRIKRILCDAGFFISRFMAHLEAQKHLYIISAPLSTSSQKRIYQIQDWRRLCWGIEIAEFEMVCGEGPYRDLRRFVVVRQDTGRKPKAAGKQLSLFKELDDCKKYRYSFMVTNDRGLSAEEVWSEYRTRANDENIFKDLKEGYGFSAFSLANFWATEAVMVMNTLVFHNLMHYLNRNILNPKQPQKQLKTLRSQHFILPALLGKSARTWILRLGVQCKKQRGKIRHLLERIIKIPHRLNCNAVALGGS